MGNNIIPVKVLHDIKTFQDLVHNGYNFDKLLVIDLCNNKLTADQITPLTDLLKAGKCPKNLVIRLWWNDFGTEGVRLFAEALQTGNCPENLTIDLSYNPIGAVGIDLLVQALRSKFCPRNFQLKLNRMELYPNKINLLLDVLAKQEYPTGFKLFIDSRKKLCELLENLAKEAEDKIKSCRSFLEANLYLQKIEAAFVSAKTVLECDAGHAKINCGFSSLIFAAYETIITEYFGDGILSKPILNFLGISLHNMEIYQSFHFHHRAGLTKAQKNQLSELRKKYHRLVLWHQERLSFISHTRMPGKIVYMDENKNIYEFNDQFQMIGEGEHDETALWRIHSNKANFAFAKLQIAVKRRETSGLIIDLLKTIKFFSYSIIRGFPDHMSHQLCSPRAFSSIIREKENYTKAAFKLLTQSYKIAGEYLLQLARDQIQNKRRVADNNASVALFFIVQRVGFFVTNYLDKMEQDEVSSFYVFLLNAYHFLSDKFCTSSAEYSIDDKEKSLLIAKRYAYKIAIFENDQIIGKKGKQEHFSADGKNELEERKEKLYEYLAAGLKNTVFVPGQQSIKTKELCDTLIGWAEVELFLKEQSHNFPRDKSEKIFSNEPVKKDIIGKPGFFSPQISRKKSHTKPELLRQASAENVLGNRKTCSLVPRVSS